MRKITEAWLGVGEKTEMRSVRRALKAVVRSLMFILILMGAASADLHFLNISLMSSMSWNVWWLELFWKSEQPSEASPPHLRTPAPRNPMHQPPPLHQLTVVTGAGFPEGTGERYAGRGMREPNPMATF